MAGFGSTCCIYRPRAPVRGYNGVKALKKSNLFEYCKRLFFLSPRIKMITFVLSLDKSCITFEHPKGNFQSTVKFKTLLYLDWIFAFNFFLLSLILTSTNFFLIKNTDGMVTIKKFDYKKAKSSTCPNYSIHSNVLEINRQMRIHKHPLHDRFLQKRKGKNTRRDFSPCASSNDESIYSNNRFSLPKVHLHESFSISTQITVHIKCGPYQ